MKLFRGSLVALLLTLPLVLSSCSDGNLPDAPDLPGFGAFKKAEATVDFNADVRPILEKKCLGCHNSRVAKRGLNLETRDTANKSWRGGAVVVSEQPEQSMLYQVSMLATGEYNPHKISYEDRNVIYTWIQEGAYWPSGAEGKLRSASGAAVPEPEPAAQPAATPEPSGKPAPIFGGDGG